MFNTNYTNEINGLVLCTSTSTFLPRIGEKIKFSEYMDSVWFVITDIRYTFKPGGDSNPKVDIYIKPM